MNVNYVHSRGSTPNAPVLHRIVCHFCYIDTIKFSDVQLIIAGQAVAIPCHSAGGDVVEKAAWTTVRASRAIQELAQLRQQLKETNARAKRHMRFAHKPYMSSRGALP